MNIVEAFRFSEVEWEGGNIILNAFNRDNSHELKTKATCLTQCSSKIIDVAKKRLKQPGKNFSRLWTRPKIKDESLSSLVRRLVVTQTRRVWNVQAGTSYVQEEDQNCSQ